MNKTLLIGIIVVAVIGIGAMLLINEQDSVVENDAIETNDVIASDGTDTATPESNVVVPEPRTIIDVALLTPELATLANVVEAAGLTEVLANEGPFTILAPDDNAFAAVPEETLAALIDPANIEDLQAVLSLHVIPGISAANDLEDGMVLTTLAGEELTVSISADNIITIGDATVIGADIEADNGIIHIIDTVITEPA